LQRAENGQFLAGHDTAEVLGALGYSAERQRELKKRGII
jgi:crotonobetainyl-CoA:carnitine CoA-transferase CaiB-like acyl-CoA transferase